MLNCRGETLRAFLGDSVSMMADMLRDMINNICYLFSTVIL
jgi:hypothetical protein